MTIAICSMIKNEHQYLKEWIDYHLNLGIDAIYLAEDITSDSHKEITDLYDNVYLTSITDIFGYLLFERKNIQRNLANFYVYKVKEDWLAFIDPDEFIMCYEDLKNILPKYENETGVKMWWTCFNANGHINKQNSSLLNYTLTCFSLTKDSIYQTKCFGNVKKNCIWTNPHDVKNAVETFDIWINHYITRSFEDYCFKIYDRGDIYYRVYRTFDDFIYYNPDFSREFCELYVKEKYKSLKEYIEEDKDSYKLSKNKSEFIKGNKFVIPEEPIKLGPYGGYTDIPVIISDDVGKINVIDPSGLYRLEINNFTIRLHFDKWIYPMKVTHNVMLKSENGHKAFINIERWND